MSQVCRTCLEVIENASQLFSLEINEPAFDAVHIKTKLEACVPEVVLRRVKNSVICLYCVSALNTAYNFKIKCLQSETKISEFLIRETTDSIDLNKIIKRRTHHAPFNQPVSGSPFVHLQPQVPLSNTESNQFKRAPIIPMQPHLPLSSTESNQLERAPIVSMQPQLPIPNTQSNQINQVPFVPLQPQLPLSYTKRNHFNRGYFVPHVESNEINNVAMRSALSNIESNPINRAPVTPVQPHVTFLNTERNHFNRTPSVPLQSQVPLLNTERNQFNSPAVAPLQQPPFLLSNAERINNAFLPFELPNIENNQNIRLPHFMPLQMQAASSENNQITRTPVVSLQSQVPLLNHESNQINRAPNMSLELQLPLSNTEDNQIDGAHIVPAQPQLPLSNTEINETASSTTQPTTTCDSGSANLLPCVSIKCPVCQDCFTSNDLLKEHIKCHAEERFKCSMCGFHSDSKPCVEEHLQTHDGLATIQQYTVTPSLGAQNSEPPLKCSNCEYSTTDKYAFVEHRVLHTGERLYSCNLCNFKSTHSSSLRRHFKIHTGDRPFRCTQCRYGASDITGLKIHMRIHTGERPFKCTKCSYSAIKRSNLRNHMLKMHGVVMPEGPPKLKRSVNKAAVKPIYSTKVDPYHVSITEVHGVLNGDETVLKDVVDEMELENNLNSYMVTMDDIQKSLQGELSRRANIGGTEYNEYEICGYDDDGEEKGINGNDTVAETNKGITFRCSVCQEPFKFKYLLRKHLSIHSRDARLYECKECEYSTTVKSHFQVHMNNHTGGNVYACDQCVYSTIYWSKMQKHNQVHSIERPYKCPHCNYRASQLIFIKSHMHVHTDSTSYLCNECPFAGETEEELRNHMEVHAIGTHFMGNTIIEMAFPGEIPDTGDGTVEDTNMEMSSEDQVEAGEMDNHSTGNTDIGEETQDVEQENTDDQTDIGSHFLENTSHDSGNGSMENVNTEIASQISDMGSTSTELTLCNQMESQSMEKTPETLSNHTEMPGIPNTEMHLIGSHFMNNINLECRNTVEIPSNRPNIESTSNQKKNPNMAITLKSLLESGSPTGNETRKVLYNHINRPSIRSHFMENANTGSTIHNRMGTPATRECVSTENDVNRYSISSHFMENRSKGPALPNEVNHTETLEASDINSIGSHFMENTNRGMPLMNHSETRNRTKNLHPNVEMAYQNRLKRHAFESYARENANTGMAFPGHVNTETALYNRMEVHHFRENANAGMPLQNRTYSPASGFTESANMKFALQNHKEMHFSNNFMRNTGKNVVLEHRRTNMYPVGNHFMQNSQREMPLQACMQMPAISNNFRDDTSAQMAFRRRMEMHARSNNYRKNPITFQRRMEMYPMNNNYMENVDSNIALRNYMEIHPASQNFVRNMSPNMALQNQGERYGVSNNSPISMGRNTPLQNHMEMHTIAGNYMENTNPKTVAQNRMDMHYRYNNFMQNRSPNMALQRNNSMDNMGMDIALQSRMDIRNNGNNFMDNSNTPVSQSHMRLHSTGNNVTGNVNSEMALQSPMNLQQIRNHFVQNMNSSMVMSSPVETTGVKDMGADVGLQNQKEGYSSVNAEGNSFQHSIDDSFVQNTECPEETDASINNSIENIAADVIGMEMRTSDNDFIEDENSELALEGHMEANPIGNNFVQHTINEVTQNQMETHVESMGIETALQSHIGIHTGNSNFIENSNTVVESHMQVNPIGNDSMSNMDPDAIMQANTGMTLESSVEMLSSSDDFMDKANIEETLENHIEIHSVGNNSTHSMDSDSFVETQMETHGVSNNSESMVLSSDMEMHVSSSSFVEKANVMLVPPEVQGAT